MTYILFCCKVPLKVYLAYLNIQEFVLASILAWSCVLFTDVRFLDELNTPAYSEQSRMPINYTMFGCVVCLFLSASISLVFTGFKTLQRGYRYYRMIFGTAFFCFFNFFFSYYLVGIAGFYHHYTGKPFSLDVLLIVPEKNEKESVKDTALDLGRWLFVMLSLMVWTLFNGFRYYNVDMRSFEYDDYFPSTKTTEIAYKESSMLPGDTRDLTVQL